MTWQAIKEISFPPEFYALAILSVIVFYMHRKIKANPDTLGKRWISFLGTMISKKIFAWGVVTVFFWYDHFVWQYMGLAFGEYLLFTAGVFGIAAFEKVQLNKQGEGL